MLIKKSNLVWTFQVALVEKNLPANADAGNVRVVSSVPGLGRSPGGRNGNPLKYSCLENPVDRGAWWATVHGVTESDTTERLHSLIRFFGFLLLIVKC